MGGVELAMLLKKRAPGHPVLMVSGMASDGLSREEGVVDGFLMKPFSRASVLDGVRKVLGLRGDF
jgi:FixJ family two-component response regulator